MDQKRLFIAIAISVAILLGFQVLSPKRPAPSPLETTQSTPTNQTPPPTGNPAAPGTQPVQVSPPAEQRDVPRLRIAGPKVQGSINLAGARIDDLVLRDYHEQVDPQSPLVRLLEPRSDPQPYYVQFGWTGEGVKVPDPDTVWTASAPELTATQPVTLSWDNGAGQVFEIVLAVDDNYLFTVQQRVRNAGQAPVSVNPWARIRRDYKPVTAGYYILHEGLLGVLGGRLQEQTYDKSKSEGEKAQGVSLDMATTGGWAGITDKYWLTATRSIS
jgi:YidC/Oxa1 family membrane protein insertase